MTQANTPPDPQQIQARMHELREQLLASKVKRRGEAVKAAREQGTGVLEVLHRSGDITVQPSDLVPAGQLYRVTQAVPFEDVDTDAALAAVPPEDQATPPRTAT